MQLLNCASDWLDRTELVIIELHDWIVPGVENTFMEKASNRGNFKLPGEKHLSFRRAVTKN